MFQRYPIRILILCITIFGCGDPGWLHGQDPPQFPDGLDELIPPGSQLPPAIFLRDEDGEPIFIPRISYREYENRNQSGRDGGRVPCSFASMEITGTAYKNHAELKVTYVLETTGENQYVSIPLASRNFHRTGPPDVTGLKDVQIGYDAELESHTVSGITEGRAIEFKADVVVRVNTTATGKSIRFGLPRTSLSLNLTVAQADPVAFVSDSMNEEIVREPVPLEDGGSQIQVDANGGDFTLNWGVDTRPVSSNQQTLEVEGDWQLRWEDPQQSPNIDVTYKVRNLTGNIQPFSIVLPESFSISPASLSDVSLEQLAIDADSGLATYRVTPAVTDSSRATFRFQIEVPSDDFDAKSPLTIRGITVQDATRETGFITIVTSRDYRLRWASGQSTRPIISNATEGGRSYEFRYDRGQFSIPIWLAAKTSGLKGRINYEVAIGMEAIETDVVLELEGTKATGISFEMDLRKWDLTQINDTSLFDLDLPGVSVDTNSIQIEIDELLESLQPLAGERRELKFTLVQAPTGDEQGRLTALPTVKSPQGRRVGLTMLPGRIHVVPRQGTSIAYDLAKSKGIEELGPASATGARSFRVLLPNTKPTLAYLANKSETDLRLAARAVVDLTGDSPILTETIEIEFSSGMIASLPVTGDELESWTATINSRPAFVKIESDGSASVHFDTLTPGAYELLLTRPIEFPEQKGSGLVLDLPVCLPTSEDLSLQQTLMPIQIIADQWVRKDSQDIAIKDGRVDVELVQEESADKSLFVVEAWVQTILAASQRRERITARVVGSANRFRIRHQSLTRDYSQLRVRVDGISTEYHISQGQLDVVLPQDQSRHLVEVCIWGAHEGLSKPFLAIAPETTILHRCGDIYWQLIVPQSQHVVSSSSTTARLMKWQWSLFGWHRTPMMSMGELDQMFGRSARDPELSGNTYLFKSSRDLANVHALASPKWVIWLLIGGVTLILSSAIVYLSPLRTPLTFFVFGFCIIGLSTVMSDLAVIFGQVSIVAVSLTAALLATQRAIAGWPQVSVFQASRQRDSSTKSVPTPVVASTRTVEPMSPAVVESH